MCFRIGETRIVTCCVDCTRDHAPMAHSPPIFCFRRITRPLCCRDLPLRYWFITIGQPLPRTTSTFSRAWFALILDLDVRSRFSRCSDAIDAKFKIAACGRRNMIPIGSNSPSNSSGVAAVVRATSPCYLAMPALSDVLDEQFSYLLAHAGHNTEGCRDCLRLAQVLRLLMRPFE